MIEQVLDCLEQMANQCERAGRLDPGPARDAVTFFRAFADRCHHGKEEQQLFPMLEDRGFSPEAGPTAVMASLPMATAPLIISVSLASKVRTVPFVTRISADFGFIYFFCNPFHNSCQQGNRPFGHLNDFFNRSRSWIVRMMDIGNRR